MPQVEVGNPAELVGEKSVGNLPAQTCGVLDRRSIVDALRVGIVEVKQQTAGKALADDHLQRVVVRPAHVHPSWQRGKLWLEEGEEARLPNGSGRETRLSF